jgi:hypothetical protein
LDTFPGRNDGDRLRINISKIYDTSYLSNVTNMYAKVKIGEMDEDVAVDASGYTGNFQRIHNDKSLLPYSAA